MSAASHGAGVWRARRAAAAFAVAAILAFAPHPGAAAEPPSAAAPPASAERLVRLGLALGDHSEREKDFYLRALEQRPDYAFALYCLADLHRARGEADEALRRYLQALAADPSYSMAHFGLADFLWHANVDPRPAEGAEPRPEISPKVRRLELARLHIQRYLDLEEQSKGGRLLSEARLLLAQVEADIAKAKNARPVPYINWQDAAARLTRPADPARSPYEGPRIPLAVEFEKASSKVSYESTYLLDAVARALESQGLIGDLIVIEGHADSSGDSAANLALAKNRAQSVRDYLVSRGLRPERFLVEGFGEGRPIVPNYTEEMRRMNRRIEIVNWTEVLKRREGAPETPKKTPKDKRAPSSPSEKTASAAPESLQTEAPGAVRNLTNWFSVRRASAPAPSPRKETPASATTLTEGQDGWGIYVSPPAQPEDGTRQSGQ